MNGKKMFLLFILLIMVFPVGSFCQDKDKDKEKIEKYFKMDLYQLLDVIITTAGKKKEKISEIPASVVLVTREEIETYGYQTLAEILENIPGMYVTDDYTSKNTGVRGFWDHTANRNVIILINNIPYKDEFISAHYLENINIPVEAIDKIEVVRGPMSVIYGNGAFFGVINIFTNEYNEKENSSQVSASFGSEKTKKIVLRVSGKKKDFEYVFNGSYFDTYGDDVALSDMTNYPSVLPFLGVSENHTTGGQLEEERKYLNFSGTFNNFSLNASYSENRDEQMPILPSVGKGTGCIFKDIRFSFGYKRKLSDIATLESKFYYFENRTTYKYDYMFDGFYGYNYNGSSGFKIEINSFISPSPKVAITFGLNYLNVLEVFSDYTLPVFDLNLYHHHLSDKKSMVTQSIFSQVNYKLSDRFKIIVGAMLEQMPYYILEQEVGDFTMGNTASTQADYSHTRVEFIPRIALIYSLNDHNIFKFLYGEAINRPSFFQNLDLIRFPNFPALKPETIQTFELNYIGQLSPRFVVNLSFFKNILDKLIYRTFFTSGGTAVFYFSNVGEMVTQGVEMTIISSPTQNLNIEVSGTYQDTQDKRTGFEDIDVGYSPKFLGYLKASYFFNKNISLAVTGNYVGEMESYWDATLAPPRRLGDKVDSYFLLGANLRIRNLFRKGIFLNLRVSNLIDEKFHYPATANNFQFADKGTIGRGRSFLLSIGWKFNR